MRCASLPETTYVCDLSVEACVPTGAEQCIGTYARCGPSFAPCCEGTACADFEGWGPRCTPTGCDRRDFDYYSCGDGFCCVTVGDGSVCAPPTYCD
ncbi:MAG TPA: hypothetical protein RMH99_04220 [Sandaracinaceae bacterium LLY-WYZ-13_1]|nr:hypothetical protein [Sandaracinaceae bacterium LLY-WYZ-13_1]